MKRKPSLAALLSFSLASPLAVALGLGEPVVESSLEAPLRARIPLIDAAGLEVDRLEASLADAAAYRDAGLVRTPLAASVRLDLGRHQGRPVLELATDQAVDEPWLDLLLRLDWPGGRRLSGVTLLLDPPDYAAMPALFEGAVGRAGAPSDATRPVTPPATGNPAWVRSGDTLGAVAERLRPDSGIDMDQMMVALVEANPEIFPSGNIHQMRAGFTLDVPPRATIVARSPERAGELVRAMNRAWAERGDGAPAPVDWEDGAPSSVAETSAQEGGAASSPRPRLTLLTDEEAAASGQGVEAKAVEPKRVPSGRVRRLEADLLASLTGRGESDEQARLERLERGWEATRQRLAGVQAERDALSAELESLREELDALRVRVSALAADGATGARRPGVAPPEADADAAREAPWWRTILRAAIERPWMLGGVALALLLALWGRRWRREEPPGDPFGDVRVAMPAGEGIPPGGEGVAVPAAADRSVRDAMPEAEAISEADIFIAYGRYDQARELLEAGLAREPERPDLRLKLLRVQLEQGDRAAAERQAEWLRETGDQAVRDEAARLLGPLAGKEPSSDAPAGDRSPATDPGPADDDTPSRADGQAPVRGVSGQDDDAPATVGAPDSLPRVPLEPSDEGRIIDYRPPSLEPAAPREETPRPPEVGVSAEPSDPPGERAPADWEVEEVAFPPLGGDNGGSADAAAPGATLTEARHLLEVGEVREARLLLERLLEVSDDTGAREEARDLLDRYQP